MRRAYVTMLCTGDAYVPGAEVLGRSLQLTGSTVPRVLLATAEVSPAARQVLTLQGWEVRVVETIGNPGANQLMFPRFANVFTKLHAWELDDFDCVVFLDSDTLVVQNIDDLFERRTFAAAPDFFMPDRFNSGVMVIEPSRAMYARIVAALAKEASYDGGDQGVLNSVFHDWYAMPVEHRLPAGYNQPNFIYQFAQPHALLRAMLERETKVIHYMVQKPWLAWATLTGAAAPWWDVYFDVHPEQAARWKTRMHVLEDRTFDYLTARVLG